MATELRGRILVVDDDEGLCELVRDFLQAHGYGVRSATSAEQVLELVAEAEFDVLVVDVNLRGLSGLELCEHLLQRRGDQLVIVMTAFGSLDTAVAAIRAGAYDFVTKPVSMEALEIAIQRAVQHVRLSVLVRRLRQRVEAEQLTSVLGDSPAIRAVYDLVDRVATSDASVLIVGESGTGKELFARAIHDRSGRKGPFAAVNCAAMPESLLESELFGHARGAFTDAHAAHKGLFVQADGGTLFLDEIAEMPRGMQAKLLRALQERRVRPIGESREIPFDARLITATNRDIEAEVNSGRFREDLYYRINVVRIAAPPLRARGNDVLLLAQSFLVRAAVRSGKPIARMSPVVAEKIAAYGWPGNVRELENCIESAVAVAEYDEIRVDDLPPSLRDPHDGAAGSLPDDAGEMPNMQTIEDRYIRRVLKSTGGNKALCARILGFDRRTLYRKLARLSTGASAD